MSTVGAGSNASDVGLIVQGTLIFLSAVVAVIGYYVQGQLRAKERRREIQINRTEKLHQARLDKVRKKISEFVGPAHFMVLTLNSMLFDLRSAMGKFYPEEAQIQSQRIKDEDLGFGSFMKGKWNAMTAEQFFGIEMMEKLKQEKDGDGARHFRIIISKCYRKLIIPVVDMINKYAGYLQEWESKESFFKLYPVAAGNGMGRNLFLIQLVQFSIEIEAVIDDWDAGKKLDTFWSTQSPYPFQVGMYLIRMMTLLREMENKEGLASHAISEELEEHNAQVIKKYDSSGASSKKVKQGGGDNNLNSTTTNNVNNSTSKYKV